MKSVTAVLVLLALACAPAGKESPTATPPKLVGAWKATIAFKSGALAPYQGLEFMYVFNAGGTMTESSNYDAAPPVPPAYGTWRETGPNRYETRYQYYATRPATRAESGLAGGGWMPAGHGVLTEVLVLAADGNSFTSTIKLEMFDPSGKPVDGGGTGSATGRRME